jgi:phage terminase large subunit GpA-like protein
MEEEELYRRRERYNCEVPNEVVCLTAGVDTQDDRFEAEVVGWGAERESWGIQYKVIYAKSGEMKEEQVWNDLDAFLNQTFTRADGAKLKIVRAFIDRGGHHHNDVDRFCKPRTIRGIYPSFGKHGFGIPYLPKPTKSNREGVPMFGLGVDTGKEQIYQHLGLQDEGANYCHFPKEEGKGYDLNYFRGLCSEKRIVRYKKGRPYYEWVIKDSAHRRNEPLDCRNYALAALELSGIVLKNSEGGAMQIPQNAVRKRKVRSGGIA